MQQTELAVKRQIEAMGSGVFEVGLYKPHSATSGEAAMIPRTWDHETLARSLAWLRLQNSHGRNIYIRPQGEHNLSLIDDLKADSVSRMKSEGFQPAVLVETSPGNFQAWLKHPKELPRETSTAAARELAARFEGDLGAADWRHFGRLAGFTNRKEKYQQDSGLYPFVRLIEASGAAYREGDRFVKELESRLELDRAIRADITRSAGRRPPSPHAIKPIEAFRANPVYDGDGTRVDLAYAIHALARGSSQNDVRQAIQSRDLSHKGTEKRQQEYVDRTLKKAEAIVSVKLMSR